MVPISIKIKNFFSHKDSEIDFTQFDSALLIGNVGGDYDISNGSGKSAIFEAILWCLFNKSRAATMDDIVFWGENSCKVSFMFKHSGGVYKVVRVRSRIDSTSIVTFYMQDLNGNWNDISGSTPSLTNEAIVDVIKIDYKTFVNSAYFRQNDISEFAETDASRKKGILKSIIDLSKWDQYEKKAKGTLREMKGECKILLSQHDGYDECVKLYEVSKSSLSVASSDLVTYSKERDTLVILLKKSISKYQEIKGTIDTERWDIIVGKIDELKLRKSAIITRYDSASKRLSKFKVSSKKLAEEIESFKNVIEGIEVDKDIDAKIKELNKNIVEMKSLTSSSAAMLSELSDIEIRKGLCYVCDQTIDDELYDHLFSVHNKKVSRYNNDSIYSKNKLNELLSKNKKLQDILLENNKFEKYTNKISSKSMEAEIANERERELVIEVSKISDEMDSADKDISLNNSVLDSLRNDNFRGLQKQISLLKRDCQKMNNMVEKKNRELGILTEKASNLKVKVSDFKMARAKYKKKQKEMYIIEKVVKLFGKSGIQTILLNAVIEDLESTANEILESICNEPFILYLDTQRVGSDGISVIDTLDLRVKKDGIIQSFKSLSGGEKFRISLALRIALSEISSRHGGSSLEFLLLDEINSPLDRRGTESLFVNVIKALEKKYKILVITHNDSLKEKFDNIIDVTKVNGESTINYISS